MTGIDFFSKLDKAKLIEAFSFDEEKTSLLYEAAYAMKLKHVGNNVYLRGLIEVSNICSKNCFYCGIRADNSKVKRYQMSEDDVMKAALWAYEQQYGSIVLQAGERTDREFVLYIENLINKINKLGNGELGITLSIGEQDSDVYKRWFDAGVHRYLLRIETSNEALYKKLHPQDHAYSFRLECLNELRKIGYQVGTGVMIGLPGQSLEHLANDILFFKQEDIDMIGMGPYVIHNDTPLAAELVGFDPAKQMDLALKMIALTRLYCEDVNIASTTALQTLHPQGRELGLQAGANILMPNIGSTKYRSLYTLYDNKPCLEDTAAVCKNCFEKRIESIGEKIAYAKWGDSPHFKRRRNG
jgi:biotin synthase